MYDRLRALADAARSLTPETVETGRVAIADAFDALAQSVGRSLPPMSREHLEFYARCRTARMEMRRQRRMREQGITEATAAMFKGRLTPSCRDWAEKVALWLRDRTSTTTSEVLTDCIRLNEPIRHEHHVRVARILGALGWRRRRIGKGVNRRYVYELSHPGKGTGAQTKSKAPGHPGNGHAGDM
jgi:hypothetical protein